MEEQGFYLEPSVINSITDDMLCMVEETFGPVTPIATYKELDEVIDRANNSPFGLATYVFTENINDSILLTGRLEYGVVGLNTGVPSTAKALLEGTKKVV